MWFPPNRNEQYYRDMLATITPACAPGLVTQKADWAVKFKEQYLAAVEGTAIPWYFPALMHAMEANGSFGRQLFDGKPYAQQTTCYGGVKAGPWSSWVNAARDRMTGAVKGQPAYSLETNWEPWRMLCYLECANGAGYGKMKNPDGTLKHSPYLVGLSSMDTPGKYTSDGKYDPNAKTQQVGAALILKELLAREAAGGANQPKQEQGNGVWMSESAMEKLDAGIKDLQNLVSELAAVLERKAS